MVSAREDALLRSTNRTCIAWPMLPTTGMRRFSTLLTGVARRMGRSIVSTRLWWLATMMGVVLAGAGRPLTWMLVNPMSHQNKRIAGYTGSRSLRRQRGSGFSSEAPSMPRMEMLGGAGRARGGGGGVHAPRLGNWGGLRTGR